MPGHEQHVRDVIVSFFWRCFPMEPEERQKRGLDEDASLLRFSPSDLGNDGVQFGDALHAAFALDDDVDLHNATVGEIIERVLVHWDRYSFEPEALGITPRDDSSHADGDDGVDDEAAETED